MMTGMISGLRRYLRCAQDATAIADQGLGLVGVEVFLGGCGQDLLDHGHRGVEVGFVMFESVGEEVGPLDQLAGVGVDDGHDGDNSGRVIQSRAEGGD